MVSLFVDAAPTLAPVILITALVVTASSAGLLWLGWREALRARSADQTRRRSAHRPSGGRALRAVDVRI